MKADRSTVTLALVVILGAWLSWKMRPLDDTPRFTLQIVKQRGAISDLDGERKPEFERRYFVPTIDFPPGGTLRHRALGEFGLQSDFFLEITGEFEVRQPQEFEFVLASDDGYRLTIDNELLGEHLVNRQFTADTLPIHLERGRHRLRLEYYQGYGPLGLTLHYRAAPGGKLYVAGESSPALRFYAQHREVD